MGNFRSPVDPPAGSSPVRSGAGQPISPAGYAPEELDLSIKRYLGICETNVKLVSDLAPKLEKLIEQVAKLEDDPSAALVVANQVTILYDRMTKAGLNLVKAADELSRLRSFLAGGPDSRPDLSMKGEHELLDILKTTATKFGFELTPLAAGAPASADTLH